MSNIIADTFKSHHEVMDALQQNFAGNDDAQRATKVDKLREDMAAACRLQEDDIKATISGLTRWTRAGFMCYVRAVDRYCVVQSCLSKCKQLRKQQPPWKLLTLTCTECTDFLHQRMTPKRMWPP